MHIALSSFIRHRRAHYSIVWLSITFDIHIVYSSINISHNWHIPSIHTFKMTEFFAIFIYLQTLKLDENNISYIEENVFVNTSLRVLFLGQNKITQLHHLKTNNNTSSLEELKLEKNLIKSISKYQVDPLYLLRKLDMRQNLVTEVDFLSFLPALTNVYLHESPFPPAGTLVVGARKLVWVEFYQTDLEIFPVMSSASSSLKVIKLEWNKINCIDVFHLSNMTRLNDVQLSGNRIRRFPDPGCASSNLSPNATADWYFPHLSKFAMRRNLLTEFPLLPGMGILSSSASIDLKFNAITDVPTERLELLKNGTNLLLSLTKNEITDMPYLSIIGPALVHAYLESNKIAYLYQEHLIGLINLETLCLSGNRIESFDFSSLALLPRVSLICFKDNRFSTVLNLTKELTNMSLTITLENNPIFCDQRICLLLPEAMDTLELTCDSPVERAGLNLFGYYIRKCGEYIHW